MSNIKSKMLIAAVSVASLVGNANAFVCSDLYHSGPYQNVSAAGFATKEDPLIVCTVFNENNAGNSAHLIMSEAESGDAMLEVKYDKSNFPTRIMDNWKDDLTDADKQIVRIVREPKLDSDAAIILTSKIQYVTGSTIPLIGNTFGMCIYGYPKEGKSWISLSVTEMGGHRQASEVCYPLPTRLFQE